jgi:hypothetical protein
MASRTPGQADAAPSRVEDIECRQAHVGDFFLAQRDFATSPAFGVGISPAGAAAAADAPPTGVKDKAAAIPHPNPPPQWGGTGAGGFAPAASKPASGTTWPSPLSFPTFGQFDHKSIDRSIEQRVATPGFATGQVSKKSGTRPGARRRGIQSAAAANVNAGVAYVSQAQGSRAPLVQSQS